MSDKSKKSDGKITLPSYKENFWESTQETLITMYAKRDDRGKPTEDIDQIIDRVATSNAIAELKYVFAPEELITLSLEEALSCPEVQEWRKTFAECIGKQMFWANTPGNINSDPEVSLKVLQYEAHGIIAGFETDEIFLRSEELRKAVESGNTVRLNEHELAMGTLARELHGRGCLAACGVAYLEDSLEGIQEAARIETIATKASMGMGLNTSPLRPWSSVTKNGAAASGPDRFYEKSISKAVEAVAQGGRRGGALIELRNSDHPDILFFIDKKKLIPPPSFSEELVKVMETRKALPGEDNDAYKRAVVQLAEKNFGELYHEYLERQRYLKNTNITVLAMPGFMEAVQNKKWIPCRFQDHQWGGHIYDPRKRVKNEKGQWAVDKYTKEPVYEIYRIEKDSPFYKESQEAIRRQDLREFDQGGHGWIYAPEVFDRIVEGMRDSGEPGIMFYELVNNANANNHVYDLNTCNPCGEQCLPAGRGKDGRLYMGNCNLTSLHAAHPSFFDKYGCYDFDAMKKIVKIQQRFMDNVTDVSWYPIPEQNMTARMERRNGGGFAGIAEFLSKTGFEFGSPDGCKQTEALFWHYTEASVEASQELASIRGVYPLWKGSRFEKKGLKVRNSCLVNNAPTGTLAQAMQTSWGVDPHNGIVFSRKVRTLQVDFVAPGFKEAMQKEGAWPLDELDQQELMEKIRKNHKSCRGITAVPERVQKLFPIRVEVSPEAYIRHLAACYSGCQKYPEAMNAISNTCSIPLGFDKQEVTDSLLLAWELGVKDLTFYPDGSRLSQPVEKIASAEYADKGTDLFKLLGHISVREVDTTETEGQSIKVKVGSPEGVSTLHLSLNHEVGRPGELVEVYARMGKNAETGPFEAIGRLASAFLQYAAQFGDQERQKAEDTIVKQLTDIQSGYTAFYQFPGDKKSTNIKSACDAIAKAIRFYRKKFTQAVEVVIPTESSKIINKQEVKNPCTKCGGSTTKIDGCIACDDCGYSKCG